MKFLLAIFGYLFLSNASMAVDKNGNYAVWGVGMKSCFSFNSVTVNYLNSDDVIEEENNSWISKLKFWENVEDSSSEVENFDKYRDYIKGYITAYNTFTDDTYSITGIMKEKEIIEWLNNYCEENPMSSVDTAIMNFAFDHHDKRMKTSRPVRRGF